MPSCPKCQHLLAMFEDGCICPICRRTYTHEQVGAMPGYDHEEVMRQLALFMVLLDAGLLKSGRNTVEFYDDGMLITHLDNED